MLTTNYTRKQFLKLHNINKMSILLTLKKSKYMSYKIDIMKNSNILVSQLLQI